MIDVSNTAAAGARTATLPSPAPLHQTTPPRGAGRGARRCRPVSRVRLHAPRPREGHVHRLHRTLPRTTCCAHAWAECCIALGWCLAMQGGRVQGGRSRGGGAAAQQAPRPFFPQGTLSTGALTPSPIPHAPPPPPGLMDGTHPGPAPQVWLPNTHRTARRGASCNPCTRQATGLQPHASSKGRVASHSQGAQR